MWKSVKFREAQPQDINQLYDLIKSSTSNGTKLTERSLYNSLFGWQSNKTGSIAARESGITFDPKLVESNTESCRALVIETDDGLIGYSIFHFHYSPWLGHSTYVDGIYVKNCQKIKGDYKTFMILMKRCLRSFTNFNDTINS